MQPQNQFPIFTPSSTQRVSEEVLSDISMSDIDDVALAPTRVVARKWSKDEDKRLLQAIAQVGENWKEVADIVKTRDAAKCMQRYVKGISPGLIKGRWSEDEDRALTALVVAAQSTAASDESCGGAVVWTEVAKRIAGRTSKQCRERWFNFLDPSLNKGSFSAEEDERLLRLYREKGRHWAQIARETPGRTENMVKVRCLALLRRDPDTPAAQSLPLSVFVSTSSSLSESQCVSQSNASSQKRERVESEGLAVKRKRERDISAVAVPTTTTTLSRSSSVSSLTSCGDSLSAPPSPFLAPSISPSPFSLSHWPGESETNHRVEGDSNSQDVAALLLDLFPLHSQSSLSQDADQLPVQDICLPSVPPITIPIALSSPVCVSDVVNNAFAFPSEYPSSSSSSFCHNGYFHAALPVACAPLSACLTDVLPSVDCLDAHFEETLQLLREGL